MAAGVKASVPSALMLTVPCAGSTVAELTLSALPSTSLSLASTAMLLSATLIAVLAVSALATGLSLTGLTARLTVAVALPPLPSMMV